MKQAGPLSRMIQVQLIKKDGQARVQGTIPPYVFKEVQAAGERAVERSGLPLRRKLSIGPLTVQLNFAGNTLIPFIWPALEHLETESVADEELSMILWDSTTDIPLPESLWNNETFEEGIRSARVLFLYDTEQNIGIYWTSDPDQIPYYEIGAPLQPILHWFFLNHGLQITHAGAVGNRNGGVLIVGKGGSGKSTTTLACLHAGLDYIGDDYCAVSFGSEPHLYSLYNTLKLNWDNVGRFPTLPEARRNTSSVQLEKAIFYMHNYRPKQVALKMPLRAIFIPRIAGKKQSEIRAASAANALMALAPSTVLQLAGAGQSTLENLSSLANRVPAYFLDLGTDLAEVAKAVQYFLTEVAVYE
jgi:hypothetical protein